jgi:hypothetical protein
MDKSNGLKIRQPIEYELKQKRCEQLKLFANGFQRTKVERAVGMLC